jgi:hypothetical protein
MLTWLYYWYVTTPVVGVDALLAPVTFSLVMLAGRIVDSLADPVIARLSDNHRGRRGRRMPFLLASGVPFAAVFVALFHPPVAGQSAWNAVYLGAALGCYEVSLGDTIGVGTPGHVTALLDALAGEGLGPDRLAVHFHDTYGQALANTVAALRCGVTVVDAAAGGLGGCPYAQSATGNLATEDLVWMLHGLGIETGVDLDALVETSRWMEAQLGKPSPSRVVRALTASRLKR